MDLVIATGQSRKSKLWKNTKMSWGDFVERLKTTTRTSETQGEFANMPKSQQDDIKDVGGFVGGKVKNGKRQWEVSKTEFCLRLTQTLPTVIFAIIFQCFTTLHTAFTQRTSTQPRNRDFVW